ncbi:MAG: hypothetical protein CMH85_14125 [Novosphingobium sp.]|nr:hypothetical protein [Novosphingobium sp.]|tara:strand:- start:2018 stop:2374 length:357 start_codon:yes stop_codon:yes gene_type:complete
MHSEIVRAVSSCAATRGPWLRLLSQVLELAGPQAEFLSHSERPWTSATFEGTRHSAVLAFHGPEGALPGEAFIAALPDHEFEVPGHLVADASIARIERDHTPSPRLQIEAEFLLLSDG